MNAEILTMGLNHTTAPVQVRERIATSACQRDSALGQLWAGLDSTLFSESLLLSTCNRTEVYALAQDVSQGIQALTGLFVDRSDFGMDAANFLYTYTGDEAVRHLFAVSSGIDSMMIGESEILGQVRRAYESAIERKTIGPVFHRLFKDAIHVGKRARSETSISTGSMSVAYAAVAAAREYFRGLSGLRVLLIGAGEMGRHAALDLAGENIQTVVVANRSLDHANPLARTLGGQAVSFEQLPEELASADLVISATSAPHIILEASTVREAMAARSDRPLCLIDIAVPRDVDPAVREIPNVQLYNIDDLKQRVDQDLTKRESAIAAVKEIIDEEVANFRYWLLARNAAPVLSNLRYRSERIRQAELDKALRRLTHLHLNEHDRNVIAALSSGIVSKLLSSPTEHLKNHVQNGDGHLYLSIVNDLFDLQSENPIDRRAEGH